MDNISTAWNSFWSGVPDVVVAALVLVLAFVAAWIAKLLTTKLMKLVGLERGMAKAGTDKENIDKTVRFIGKLVYFIVFLLFLPGIFEKLGLNNVATPIVSMMNDLVGYLPKIIGAVIIVIIGLFIAKIVKELLTPLLRKLKLNDWAAKIGINTEKIDITGILATIAYAVIAVIFTVEALSTLELEILTKIGDSIIAYLPSALSAAIILLIAFLLASWVEHTLNKKFGVSVFTSAAARVAIIATGIFMALSQLGVASVLVNGTYMFVIGALAVAFAIAFGIGGRDFAAHTMKKIEQKLDSKNNKTNRH
ncbi:hypothetical protein IIZ72_01245 [Candidatus Saccharibacteria bacterium]|nr:hypothetical protein [Candidatus Saccharibacteria bacterium]